jgi:hypothetical protein
MSDRLLVILSKLHYAANAIAPPNKLPPELLRAIFSYLHPGTHRDWEAEQTPPYTDLLAVSRVCRNWREIAASATELWTYIIIAGDVGGVPVEEEIYTARLCMHRSGVRPLDLLYTASSAFDPLSVEELIPDRRRLRSVVYWYADEASEDQLASFFSPALYLERLEFRGHDIFSFPTLFSNTGTSCLRELVVSKCTPWPNNQFGSLNSLNLLRQEDIDVNIYSLLDALRCSPHLEELLLERESRPDVEPQQPPERKIPTTPLHSLKRLYIGRLSAEATKRLLGGLDLLPNRISMRFANVSADVGAIFPETFTPELSPRAATKLELIYPSMGGEILHATNGVAHTRLAYQDYPSDHQIFHWIAEKPHEEYPLKELWLHIDRDLHYELPPPHALRDLETLVIETDPNEKFNSMFFLMLSPDEDGVPSPLLSTLELRNVFGVARFGEVLKARSNAGFRLKTLRIRWLNDREARMMAPLVQFVDKLEFYYVTSKSLRGLELPDECMTRSEWWEPWSREFVGEMECEPNGYVVW